MGQRTMLSRGGLFLSCLSGCAEVGLGGTVQPDRFDTKEDHFMSLQLVCDGCGSPLLRKGESMRSGYKDLVVEGERVDGTRGALPLPQSDFHWCSQCARIAFVAVEQAKLSAVAGVTTS